MVKTKCDFCLEVSAELHARGLDEVCGVCFDEATEADEAENRKLDRQ